jgi:heparosan-N-sulfate-glucuronate 5-epimerase
LPWPPPCLACGVRNVAGVPRVRSRQLDPVRLLLRKPQLRGAFAPGDIASGYYNDLSDIAGDHGSPRRALIALESMTGVRRLANPISIANLGLGAWQLAAEDSRWLEVVAAVSDWISDELDDQGRLAFEFSLPHTYRLEAPWYSAMAQGEVASLMLRAAVSLQRTELARAAERAASTLLSQPSSLVAETEEGPVLQEYPTDPPAHVLNGWIAALWGLYDIASAPGELSGIARDAFGRGMDALAARLPAYNTGWNWSRYDLFPHPIVHVTSPFYHRLHIEQLRAMHDLDPRPVFAETADRWESGLKQPFALTYAVGRKVAFRMLNPRKKVR